LSFDLNIPWGRGFLDRICVDPCGLIRIEGWWDGVFEDETVPVISIDGIQAPFLQYFRFSRKDAALSSDEQLIPIGLGIDYLIPDTLVGTFGTLAFSLGDRSLQFTSAFTFIDPHYKQLFSSGAVWHRDDIYGSGPPNSVVHPDVFELARRLPPAVLDFGCGKGALLSRFRQLGIEAYGIELFSEGMRAALIPEVSDRITFYDGSFPTRFENGQFNSVVCSEVLEHIPDYRGAIQEIARIAKHSAFFTVPDASAIPAGFRHGAVPWHLLEGTHVNFFNQTSLTNELRRCFRTVQIGRLGPIYLNDAHGFVSLTAVCSK
jgi:2-polyprenyl-3-methyl-5-hydroxy-6-metoxy-1,4-benzoquinol methylase